MVESNFMKTAVTPYNRLILVTAIVCSLASAIIAIGTRGSSSVDGLAVDKTLHDLGDLRQQVTVKTTFLLTNDSAVKLNIFRVITNCGCTVAEIDKKRLQSGESSALTVAMQTEAARGKLTSRVQVLYKKDEEEQSKALSLGLVANVLPDVDYAPSKPMFRDGQSVAKTITLSSKFLPELAISEAYCGHSAFQVDPVKTEHDGAITTWKIRVCFDAKKWTLGNNLAHLIVKTNSERTPEVRVPLTVQ